MGNFCKSLAFYALICYNIRKEFVMNYQEIKALLEEKEQTQLLKYYDELDEAGREKLLEGIANIDWSFEDALKNPADMSGKGRDIRPIDGLRRAEIEKDLEKGFDYRKITVEET